MTCEELIEHWKNAASSGSLLSPKHDPNNLAITWSSYRSILTQQMSGSLQTFIHSGNYTINQYSDVNYPTAAGLFELIPEPSSGFSVVGSGIASGSMTPSDSLDILILVSGNIQGWHIYAESSSVLSGSVSSGRLTLIQSLTP